MIGIVLLSAVLGQSADAAFEIWDVDRDGKLTADELRAPKLFARLDADRDGVVTLAEARAAYGGGARTFRYARIRGVDPNLLSLDLYAPEKPGKHPVMVMIHGGAWRTGDKANAGMTRDKVPHFTRAGYVYISINYRLSPAVKHPVHVQDVARALAWIHTNVAKHGGDPDRIFLMGHSAGAHLAALVATDGRRLAAEKKPLTILKGVVLLDSAAYNVPRLVGELRGPAALYEQAFGKALRDASPLFHVAPDRGIPPFLIFHAGRRRAGAVLSQEFAAALNKAGAPARVVHAPDRDHGGMNRCIGEKKDPYTRMVMEFLAAPRRVKIKAER